MHEAGCRGPRYCRLLRTWAFDPRSPTHGDRGSLTHPSGTWQLQDLQLLQPGYSVGSSRCGLDLAVNVEDLSILPNIKRPAFSDGSTFMYHTVRLGDLLSWIAEDGIIDTKRFGESFVVFRSICAGGKVGDIGVLEGFAILTE
jgi:hypothetical protein